MGRKESNQIKNTKQPSTSTYDYGCNTEIYELIRIATDDAGSYPWLILRKIRECVTWAYMPWSRIHG